MGVYTYDGSNLQFISGRGKAEYGASTIRTGIFTSPALDAESASTTQTVTFSTPMPDGDYIVELDKSSGSLAYVYVTTKTATGFTVVWARPYNAALAAGGVAVTYTAFKLYTDNEYNSLIDSLPNNISDSNKLLSSANKGINLFDNGYFVGGGSQQGGGQFPINQRGQTSYSGGYTVDRWSLYRNDGQLKVLSNGLELTTTTVGNAANAIRQKLEQPLPSGTYTFSALIDQVGGGGGNTWSEIVFRDGNDTFLNVSASTEGTGVQLISCTYTGSAAQTFDVNTKQSSAGVTKCKIIAVKLECGDTQTLARNIGTKANPNWVLNDLPPNYQQELAKCQRYFVRYTTPDDTGAVLGFGHCRNTTTARVCIPLPTVLRATPTLTFSDLSKFVIWTGTTTGKAITAVAIISKPI